MATEERIVVSSIDGLYDEVAEPKIYQINERSRFCFSHKFINASLIWESCKFRGNYSVNLESPKKEFQPAWGVRYGGIRFCVKCKHIDCIHIWSTTRTYRIEHNPFQGEEWIVSHCIICGQRIRCGGYTYHNPSRAAFDLINEVHLQVRGTNFPLTGYGSGFYCEFPVRVSVLLLAGKINEARDFITTAFTHGLDL